MSPKCLLLHWIAEALKLCSDVNSPYSMRTRSSLFPGKYLIRVRMNSDTTVFMYTSYLWVVVEFYFPIFSNVALKTHYPMNTKY